MPQQTEVCGIVSKNIQKLPCFLLYFSPLTVLTYRVIVNIVTKRVLERVTFVYINEQKDSLFCISGFGWLFWKKENMEE